MRLQDMINSNLIKHYKTFSKLNSKNYEEIIKQIKDTFYSSSKHVINHFFPLIKYIIKNNNVDYEVLLNDKKYNKDSYPKLNNIDDRIIHTYKLIKKSIHYIIKKNKEIPNTILFIWISDRYPWDKDIDKKLPIYLYAKPKDTNFLIFPDNTFYCFNLDKKYVGKCSDFNAVKKEILKNCITNFENKPDIMYFKGTSTTKRNIRIRENLEIFSQKYNWLQIYLDAWTNYEKIYNMCNYKYLLNLPGHYPWSNRFKYLFLMKSLVININANMKEYKTNNIEYNWISFIDYIVKPNKDYINIDSTFYWSDTINVDNHNYNESVKVMNELQEIYNSKDINKYNKIINNGFKKVNKLSNKHIYNYIYQCIIENSKIIT